MNAGSYAKPYSDGDGGHLCAKPTSRGMHCALTRWLVQIVALRRQVCAICIDAGRRDVPQLGDEPLDADCGIDGDRGVGSKLEERHVV